MGTCFAIDERAELGDVLTLFLRRIMLMLIERRGCRGEDISSSIMVNVTW
jgi:hypothetical protein